MDESLAMACSAGMNDLDDNNVPLRSMTNDDDDDGSGLPAGALNLQSAVGERVPPFLSKLFQIVSQPQTEHCVRWSPAGDSFLVADHHIFSKQVLPQFFKHSSLCSFIRQLNTYGFRKRTNMGSSSDQMEFFNENFRRGHLDLLCRIKRTGQSKGSSRSGGTTPPHVAAIAGPIRGPSSSTGGGLVVKQASNAQHATKTDLMHVQSQVNALISEVRDMRTLMHQYMMEVDKRVNLFSMEMHGVGGQWYQAPGQVGAATPGFTGQVSGQSPPASGGQGQLDALASANLAAMVKQQGT
jgi:hypothetical protein